MESHAFLGQSGDCRLSVELLGGFRVWVGPNEIPPSAWRLRNAAHLVKLLALSAGHTMHREAAMDALWPDLPPDAASNNFRYALHTARRVLRPLAERPDQILHLQGPTVRLAPPSLVRTDVGDFEAAAAGARRARTPGSYVTAVSLYAGDLLPEDRYEDWAAARREALRELFLGLLIELARIHESSGNLDAAVTAAEQAVAHEPAHEEAHATLIRLFARQGRRHQALRQYIRLRQALHLEFDLEPDPETQQLYQDVLTGRYPSSVTEVGSVIVSPAAVDDPALHPKHNLPIPLTSFIGRKHEIAEVSDLLRTHRLLTLTGVGGAGKSRLARQVASRLLDHYADGAWLVDLAPVSDPERVLKTVAVVLDVNEERDRPLSETLVRALAPRSLLLLLDNCEHVIASCAAITGAILRACPHVRILATSRERLDVPGERTWSVPPMELPNEAPERSFERLQSAEAVQLFQERAALARPAFSVTADNIPAIAHICRRLDGLPLAIELAAARLAILTPDQLADRLDNALHVLTSGGRVAEDPRHQALRATLDWSHDLLSEPEQVVFRRLAVFTGGWTLEAAEAVVAGDDIRQEEVLDLLARLVDRSLVAVEARQESVRYRFLETVRQYAIERLGEHEEAEVIRERHAVYFVAFTEHAHTGFESPVRTVWQEQAEGEIDNLRGALDWALQGGSIELGLRLAAALGDFWFVHGRHSEGRTWLSRLLSHPAAAAPELRSLRADVLAVLFMFAYRQGDFEAARRLAEEGLGLQREMGEPQRIAWWLSSLAMPVGELGDLDRSEALLLECLALSREIGDRFNTARALDTLGELNRFRGTYERAYRYYAESLELFREVDALPHVANVTHNLGQTARMLGDLAGSIAFQRESLRIYRELQQIHGVIFALAGLAVVAADLGRVEQAVRLLAAVETHYEAYGLVTDAADQKQEQQALAAAREALDDAAFAAAREAGRALSLEEAVAEALTIEPVPSQIPPSRPDPRPPLSPRERDVAALVVRGLTNQQIATELGMSQRTVDTHVGRILRKLGLSSRREMAHKPVSLGLIPPDHDGSTSGSRHRA